MNENDLKWWKWKERADVISTKPIVDPPSVINKKLELLICKLYKKYHDELHQLNLHMKQCHILFPPDLVGVQTCEMENEINWLLIRHFKPEMVVEMSPCSGWSSCWILDALNRNETGKLISYDILDISAKRVPQVCPYVSTTDIWELVVGDCKKTWDETQHLYEGKQIEYIFIDSDHSEEFAYWYLENVFPKAASNCCFGIHDMIDTFTGEHFERDKEFVGTIHNKDGNLIQDNKQINEDLAVFQYLKKYNISYVNPNTASESIVGKKRQKMRLLGQIHNIPSTASGAIFFQSSDKKNCGIASSRNKIL